MWEIDTVECLIRMKNAPSFLRLLEQRDTIEDELVIGGISFDCGNSWDVVESIGIRI
jgi:hypothetical protein